jgi:hypothetical protein
MAILPFNGKISLKTKETTRSSAAPQKAETL